jgi:hypothetical protein
MKLVGNSVSMPVIQILGEAIIKTGVFDEGANFLEEKTTKLLELSTI